MTSNQIYNSLNFAKSFDEAEERAKLYRFEDPLPEIQPALLNKTDIANYVAKTGMIHPFDPDKLKPASYEVKLGDEVLYWDENSDKQHLKNLTSKNSITIRQNSITYVGVEIKFNIPFYIALRFNLIITHVHRGLLLGTGPLVDPGFNGILMIPIHNLTTNDYSLRPGDDLIAMEFTKLSYDKVLGNKNGSPEKKHYDNNVKKRDLGFDDYVDSAIKPLHSVQSSLEQTVGKMKEEVEKANETVDQVKEQSSRTARIITWAGLFVAATLIITSLSIFFQTKSLVQDANKYVSDSTISISSRYDDINTLLAKQKDSIAKIKTKIDRLITNFDSKQNNTGKKLNELKDNLKLFESQLNIIEEKVHRKTK